MDGMVRDKRYCIAYWCLHSDRKNPELSFFSLPQDKERRLQWLKLIGREDLASRENLKCKSYVVCSAHFDSSQLKIVRLLRNNANPKEVNMLHQTLNEPTPHCSKNEESLKRKVSDIPTTSGNKCRKLHDSPRISSPVTKDPIYIYPEESEYDALNKFHKLIEWQNELKKKGKETELKMFALNLLIYSPHAYQCLKTVLKLPSKKTLISYKLNISPSLDVKVLNRIEMKLKSLPVVAKHCIICIDRFPLLPKIYYDTKADEITGFHSINERKKTEMAKYAYVIMIQGIYFKWQQPVAYALLGDGEHYDELDMWLGNVISKLSEIGVEIRAITSDDSSYFTKFAKDVKNVTEIRPYIKYKKTQIYYIFDVLHLMTSVRNYLLTNDLGYGSKKITWHYIKMIYRHDTQKESKQRLLPKLTSSHIEPNEEEKLNVQLVLETLSRSVSSALHAYIDLEHIPEEARPTAHFIETLNNLFDVLNSSKPKNTNEMELALQMTEQQKKIIKEAIEMLVIIRTSTGSAEIIKNFLISIKAVKMLQEDLKLNKFSYLPTRRLNKDCLKTFYNDLVSKQNFCKLSPIQFRRRFSKLFLMYLIKSSSPNANYGLDICDVLSKVDCVSRLKSAPEPSLTSAVALGPDTDYQMNLPEDNTLIYVSSYLFFKCTKKHKCVSIGRFWDSCRNLSESNLFTKDVNDKSGFYDILKIPSKEFIQYIQNLESAITQNLFRLIKKNPGTQLYKTLRTVPAKVPCSCFPLSYLLKLFVRLRIYQTLKFNNRGKNTNKKYLKIKHL